VADAAPLAGLRVLDLTRLLPGPVCTLYLADLGADVVKIEDTGAGDYARALDTTAGSMSALYRNINRNKRSVAINLKDARGRAAFLQLARDADVVVESFRPGVVAALGIDYTTVAATNARVVYAAITGYGQDGPRALHAGHDINYIGYAGVLDEMGSAVSGPALPNLQVADLLGGAASAAVAILAALYGAARSGRGRYIDVAMADATLAHNQFALHALEQWGHSAARGDDLLTGGVPCYGVYATSDGRFLAVGALEHKFWQRLCAAIERPHLVDQQQARGAAGKAAREELAALFASAPLAHWVALLEPLDCCVTPVATLDEALCDPQFAARGMVRTRADGSRSFAAPFKVSDHAVAERLAAPRQGQHSREILEAAGMSAGAVTELARDGVILCG
jgi:crotonobetainyl-CoA:carnitine CoA-transferase CaiB-like acyl-CoA transferase